MKIMRPEADKLAACQEQVVVVRPQRGREEAPVPLLLLHAQREKPSGIAERQSLQATIPTPRTKKTSWKARKRSHSLSELLMYMVFTMTLRFGRSASFAARILRKRGLKSVIRENRLLTLIMVGSRLT